MGEKKHTPVVSYRSSWNGRMRLRPSIPIKSALKRSEQRLPVSISPAINPLHALHSPKPIPWRTLISFFFFFFSSLPSSGALLFCVLSAFLSPSPHKHRRAFAIESREIGGHIPRRCPQPATRQSSPARSALRRLLSCSLLLCPRRVLELRGGVRCVLEGF